MLTLSVDALNSLLLLVTIVLTLIALLLALASFCVYRMDFCNCSKSRCRAATFEECSKSKRNSSSAARYGPGYDEIDFIDSKNTNLVSSTIRVESLHSR